MSLALCIIAFFVTLWLTRRSLVWGITSTLAFGYFYGILRANLAETMAHFIFDGAVIGFYLGWIMSPRRPEEYRDTDQLQPWLVLLIGWPVLLTLLPIQDPMVQLVGLRGSVFLLPLILVGARMSDADRHKLALPIALLNLVVLGFAMAEFFIGLESFYPYSEVTELIYRSRGDDAAMSYRIPATFANAHAYAGTMVCTLPLLVSRWTGPPLVARWRTVLVAGMVSAMIGVFVSAARTHAIVLFILIFVATLSLQMRPSRLVVWLIILGIAGWVAWQDTRLQRFTTLADAEYIATRLGGSVNASFLTLLVDYPMGNGIGGGGTSLPYFLARQVANPVVIENEYGRILLELGLPGLILWVAFALWSVARGIRLAWAWQDIGHRLAVTTVATYLLTALTGVGMFTSIPQSAFLMLFVGWTAGGVFRRGRERAG